MTLGSKSNVILRASSKFAMQNVLSCGCGGGTVAAAAFATGIKVLVRHEALG